MQITDVETILLSLPEIREIGDGCQDLLVIKIHTDRGITGLGEVHTNAPAAKAVIEAPLMSVSASGMGRLLVGEDPRDINRLWDKLYRKTQSYGRRGLGIHVLSGIDIALWDILGKSVGQPVWRLLGGARRDKVAAYASDLDPGDPGALSELAQKHVESGFRAMKFGWGGLGGDVRQTVRTVAGLRRAVGDDVDIMIDLGFAAPLEDAIYLGRGLADHGVYFLEEPLDPDDLEGFARLTAVSPTPIATGEKETMLRPYLDLMDRGGLRIIQPDVARVGGITETLRILAHAEARGVRVIPHCWSADILIAATLHVLAVARDAPFLEFNATDNPLRRDLAAVPFRPVDGLVAMPDTPGLGIELNEEAVERFRVDA
jgi:L-rhamnonate dehydratase